MLNALTIDVEDWYHPELVRAHVPASQRFSQISTSTHYVLDLLEECGCRATFFVVGEVLQDQPDLVTAVLQAGHELGCHGMSHVPLWDLTPDRLRADLHEFIATCHAIAPGASVIGFRAPTFSLDNRTSWALPILAEFGYRYDSSIFPARTPMYGVAGGPLVPYRPSLQDVAVEDPRGPMLEFPMSVWSFLGIRLPICGGFYLRTLPMALVHHGLRRINQQRSFTLYAHPWEVYPGTPRWPLPLFARFATYHHIDAMRQRLADLISAFRMAPMRDVLEARGDLRL